MVALGIIITAATLLVVLIAFLRARRFPLPWYGVAGLAALVAAEILMFFHVWPVSAYFTPVAWTAYICLADAAVFSVQGRSLLHDTPRELLKMAALSIPLWLIFEAYNLRLVNWTYVGVPHQLPLALLGYGWSFATITPGIIETAELIESFGWFKEGRPVRFSPGAETGMAAFGAICVAAPLLVPRHVASYLFGLVWIGFVFLLDPINRRLGWPSLLADWAAGRRARFWSLFASGWVCGWLWEFWNFWASAKWHYIFPMFQQWKIFEMPAPGYLGFLPFALECYVMYAFASRALARLTAAQLERGK